MRYWTLAEIKAQLHAECDTEDEVFVRPGEILGYINEGIDEAEGEIHTLYEDYFLKKSGNIALAANDQLISIPTNLSDIYGDKIREIIFTTAGGSVYSVNRLKDWKKIKEKAFSDNFSASGMMSYFIINNTAGNPQLQLVPKAPEAGNLVVWYLRNANRLVADTDVCDIPEFVDFVIKYAKYKIFAKEGHALLAQAESELEKARAKMNGVLATRTPDMENEIEMDMSSYDDMN